MGHHLTDDGRFKSDKYPELPVGKIVLSFTDPRAQLGLWITAIDYQAADPELAEDMMRALRQLGSVPPVMAIEDAWAWSAASHCGLNPYQTGRAFAHVNNRGEGMVHIFSTDRKTTIALRGALSLQTVHIHEHVIRTPSMADGVDGPSGPTADLYETIRMLPTGIHREPSPPTDPQGGAGGAGLPNSSSLDACGASGAGNLPPPVPGGFGKSERPDFAGFLAALREARQWPAVPDPTGERLGDQRSLHELAAHVERVGRALGVLPDAP